MARLILGTPTVLLLPLVLLALLSHLPSSTPATVTPPLSKLFKKTDNDHDHDSASASAPAPAPAPSTTDPSKEDKDDDDKGNKMVSPTNGAGWYKGMPREFVNGHNKVRARYGVPPVQWDNKLARYARRWANAMRKDCVLKHSGGRYGESVFVGRDGWNATAEDALWMWGAEEPIYDKQTGNCTGGRHFRECGHFALMVNKDNRRIGCGRAECFNGAGTFISCNYYFLNRD